jgi:hypothetical protein
MPLYFSGGAAPSSTAGRPIVGPGTYRDQWNLTFGLKSPTVTIKGAKITAFGDLFVPVPVNDVKDPATAILNSRAIRFGIITAF